MKQIEHILVELYKSEEGRLGNVTLREKIGTNKNRYFDLRDELKEQGLVDSAMGKGGATELTVDGEEKARNLFVDNYGIDWDSESNGREKQLYDPLIHELKENETDQDQEDKDKNKSIVIDTHNDKYPGKWSNPDGTLISFEIYDLLRDFDVILSTFEVKPWKNHTTGGEFDVEDVYETAGHNRFAHESTLVVEFPPKSARPEYDNQPIDPLEYLESWFRIKTACERFGVGLSLLVPGPGASWKLEELIEPETSNPPKRSLNKYLDYLFSHHDQPSEKFNNIMGQIKSQFNE